MKKRKLSWQLRNVILFVAALSFFGLQDSLCAQASIERISVASNGNEGNGHSQFPDISDDGRYVAFHSEASNFVSGSSNVADVFVRDRKNNTTERMSVASDGTAGYGRSHDPTISADGRFVTFYSLAPNFVSGDSNNAWDIFVRDRENNTTELISMSIDGGVGNNNSHHAYISSNGRFVTYSSWASNLVPGDTNNAVDVFVRDRQLGTTERVSISTGGVEGNGDSAHPWYSNISISSDGRFVAFPSAASNLIVDDTNGDTDIFVRDRLNQTTERVNIATDGTQSEDSSGLYIINFDSISDDGRYVAFMSPASNLVSDDSNDTWDIFVRDREKNTTERISVASDGSQSKGVSHDAALSMSSDGRFITFKSAANDLISGDTNGVEDNFVHDTQTHITERFSVASDGSQANSYSHSSAISSDGRYISFVSNASNLVPNDTNNLWDVFFVENPLYDGLVPPNTNHAPVITLLGDNPLTITQGTKFDLREGILAQDQEDGDLSDDIEINGDKITQSSPVGIYYVYYNIKDFDNISAVPLERKIIIKDAQSTYQSSQQTCDDLPTLPAASKGLVYIVHGWNGSGDDKWVMDMVTAIGNTNEWHVGAYDWKKDAVGSSMFGIIPTSLPTDILAKASVHGQCLADHIVASQKNYPVIHFIAHSAGSLVVNDAISALKSELQKANRELPEESRWLPEINVTFLDAYAPSGLDKMYGLNAEYAEHYVDKRDIAGFIHSTNLDLSNAYNFDISKLDSNWLYWDAQQTFNIFDQIAYLHHAHAWPHDWYLSTIKDQTIGDFKDVGFPLAYESGWDSQFPNYYKEEHYKYFPGGKCELKDENAYNKCQIKISPSASKLLLEYLKPLNFQTASVKDKSTTGSIEIFDPVSFVEKTGSPVWYEIYADISKNTNVLKFEYQFLSATGSQGVFTIFIDNRPIFKIDERIAGLEKNETIDIPTGELIQGKHIIGFRLDPFSEVQSALQISNVQFGFLERKEIVDSISPYSTISISGTKENNGWYFGKATITLNAQDNEEGAGVKKTEYSIDNGTIWVEYEDPFDVTGEGEYKILYRSEDWFGNVEETKSETFTIVNDTITPTTTLTKAGDGGPEWYLSNVQITLTATDNDGGSGVDKTEYSLDGRTTWLEYKDSFTISEEGIHQIQYRSIDWFGNQEEVKTAEIKIDKTAPEANISASVADAGVEVDGTDNLTNVTIEEKEKNVYTITDEAGNITKIQLDGKKIRTGKNMGAYEKVRWWYAKHSFWNKFFNQLKSGKEITSMENVKIRAIQYNDEPVIQFPKNDLRFVWKQKKDLVTLLEQHIEVHGNFKIIGVYNEKKDKTDILIHKKGKPQKESLEGLKILNLKTNNGQLEYAY